MRKAPLILIFLTGLLFSCDIGLLASQDIMVKAPPRPVVWAGMEPIAYRVEWIDEKGMKRDARLPEGESIELRLRRGCCQAIALTLEPPYEWCKPAGFLYPFDLEPEIGLADTWRDAAGTASFMAGYAAAVAHAILKAGYDPWKWPVEKLADPYVVKDKDPWNLPAWRAAEMLIQGGFRLSLFPEARATFELPDEGPWWPESALCPAPGDQEGGPAQALPLSEGFHAFSNGEEFLWVRIAEGEAISLRGAAGL